MGKVISSSQAGRGGAAAGPGARGTVPGGRSGAAQGARRVRDLQEEALQERRRLLLRRGVADLPGRGHRPVPRHPEEARQEGPAAGVCFSGCFRVER